MNSEVKYHLINLLSVAVCPDGGGLRLQQESEDSYQLEGGEREHSRKEGRKEGEVGVGELTDLSRAVELDV